VRISSVKALLVSGVVAAAAATPFVAVTPAAAAAGPPDLTVSASASPNSVAPYGAFTLTAYVSNSSKETCHTLANGEDVCTFFGKAVSGVTVTFTIPTGATYWNGSVDHGFSCITQPNGGSVVTCWGGNLAMDDTATLHLNYSAPGGAGTSTVTATVDPSNTIVERSETNNTASASVVVNTPPTPTPTPPPAKPDLVISSITGDSNVALGGQATYTATIANVGQATATNVGLLFGIGTDAWTLVSSTSSGGLGPCSPGYDEFKLYAHCPASGGITLAAGQSATVSVVVQIPSGATTGNVNTYAIADPGQVVSESNESNNTSPFVVTFVNS
jgi:hypothetical protein